MTRLRTNGALGRLLRAARLRFHEAPTLRAWMRITIVGAESSPGAFKIELVPRDELIPRWMDKKKVEHVVWWEGSRAAEEKRILELAPDLAKYANPTKPLVLYFNEDGTEAVGGKDVR